MTQDQTPTETIIAALRVLARDIQSGDGVANSAINQAADRMEELNCKVQRCETALKAIAEHQKIIGGSMAFASATFLIAMNALSGENKDERQASKKD